MLRTPFLEQRVYLLHELPLPPRGAKRIYGIKPNGQLPTPNNLQLEYGDQLDQQLVHDFTRPGRYRVRVEGAIGVALSGATLRFSRVFASP